MALQIRGVENRFELPEVLARESLFRLHYNLVFPRMCAHTYSPRFADKIGDRISVKLPYYAKVNAGRVITSASKSPLVDRTIEIKIDKRFNFVAETNDEERTLDITAYGDRYLRSGIEELAHKYDIEIANNFLPNVHALGTKNNAVGTDLGTAKMMEVRAFATELAIPLNLMNYGVCHPLEFAHIGDDIKLINTVPGDAMVASAIRSRFKGMMSDFALVESVHMPLQKIAVRGSTVPVIDGANQDGKSIVIDNVTASHNDVIFHKGQLITIAGVEEVHVRGDKAKTGRLKTFTVTEDVVAGSGHSTSTDVTVQISPEIVTSATTTTDGQNSSVSMAAFRNVSAGPADNAVVTVIGDSDSEYRQSVFFERSAQELVHVALHKFESAPLSGIATESQTGLTVSMTGDFDINSMEETQRYDILFGTETVYPDLALRYLGGKV